MNVDRDEDKSNIYVCIGEYGQRRSFQLGGRKEASRGARQAQFPIREWAFASTSPCELYYHKTIQISILKTVASWSWHSRISCFPFKIMIAHLSSWVLDNSALTRLTADLRRLAARLISSREKPYKCIVEFRQGGSKAIGQRSQECLSLLFLHQQLNVFH